MHWWKRRVNCFDVKMKQTSSNAFFKKKKKKALLLERRSKEVFDVRCWKNSHKESGGFGDKLRNYSHILNVFCSADKRSSQIRNQCYFWKRICFTMTNTQTPNNKAMHSQGNMETDKKKYIYIALISFCFNEYGLTGELGAETNFLVFIVSLSNWDISCVSLKA